MVPTNLKFVLSETSQNLSSIGLSIAGLVLVVLELKLDVYLWVEYPIALLSIDLQQHGADALSATLSVCIPSRIQDITAKEFGGGRLYVENGFDVPFQRSFRYRLQQVTVDAIAVGATRHAAVNLSRSNLRFFFTTSSSVRSQSNPHSSSMPIIGSPCVKDLLKLPRANTSKPLRLT